MFNSRELAEEYIKHITIDYLCGNIIKYFEQYHCDHNTGYAGDIVSNKDFYEKLIDQYDIKFELHELKHKFITPLSNSNKEQMYKEYQKYQEPREAQFAVNPISGYTFRIREKEIIFNI